MATALAAPSDTLLTRQQAADYLHVRPQTLALWFSTGRWQLRCIKVGSKVLYRRSDLDNWLASRTATSSAAGLPR